MPITKTELDRIKFIRAALQSHIAYWDDLRAEMRKYKNAYYTHFYEDEQKDETSIRVETSDAYSAIESLMGSLFTKYPGIEVENDLAGQGDKEVTKKVTNNFLDNCRQQIENAARMSLIFTHSFLKLAPRESNDMLNKVALRAVPPWQVILDRDAAAFEDSRFIGHNYYISIDDANEKFGKQKWTGVSQKDYFTNSYTKSAARSYMDSEELPSEYLYIEIVEMYDFQNDELLFWSSQYKNGNELLGRSKIPVTTFDERPLSNLVPFYFGRRPDRPMEGYGVLSRIYDQVFEKNVLRSFWANAVRRDTRQYIYKEGSFDDDQLAKITAGVDGAMIPSKEQSLAGLITLVPNAELSANHSEYLQYIDQDLQRGSMTAAFTRGESTKATATEINALAQYTASELGKMARDRDAVIESVSLLYVRMLLPLIEEGETSVIVTDNGAKTITSAKLDADWKFYAIDSGSTPLSDSVKKQQLVQLVPTLTALGVPNAAILDELVRLYSLPVSFKEVAAAPVQQLPGSTEAPISTSISNKIGGV